MCILHGMCGIKDSVWDVGNIGVSVWDMGDNDSVWGGG